jgi:Collagen triple helix repeat (20 copies)
MLSHLRNRFGIPGVISVIALVFAMLGGAYAASNNGGGKATASAKAKKGPRGPRGKTGPAGPAGPAGPTGPAGANGAKGDAGAKGDTGSAGSAGAPGAPGKNVTVTAAKPTECNELGGALVKVEGAGSGIEVCNGEEGEQGEKGDTGEPWTAGGTLPPNATETGVWRFDAAGAGAVRVPISFTVPLSHELEEGTGTYHFVGGLGNGTTCPGNAQEPTAVSGNLCVYSSTVTPTSSFQFISDISKSFEGASRPGALLNFSPGGAESASGSWAVTG